MFRYSVSAVAVGPVTHKLLVRGSLVSHDAGILQRIPPRAVTKKNVIILHEPEQISGMSVPY